jgi:hypothetical protein
MLGIFLVIAYSYWQSWSNSAYQLRLTGRGDRFLAFVCDGISAPPTTRAGQFVSHGDPEDQEY